MLSNKLQMNEDKTEVLLVTPKRVAKSEPLPEFMNIDGTCVKFCPSLRNLGVTLDSTLSLHQHVLDICRSAFLELHRINSIRNFLSADAVKTLLCSLVLSRIDYCNYLLADLPQCLLKKIQYVQNAAAKMIFGHQNLIMSRPFFESFTGYPLAAESSTKFLHCVTALYLELGHKTYQT